MYVLGFDIGGTKCAVITAEYDGENIKLLKKMSCSTDLSVAPQEMIEKLNFSKITQDAPIDLKALRGHLVKEK